MARHSKIITLTQTLYNRYMGRDGAVNCHNERCGRALEVNERVFSRCVNPAGKKVLYCLECAEELNII